MSKILQKHVRWIKTQFFHFQSTVNWKEMTEYYVQNINIGLTYFFRFQNINKSLYRYINCCRQALLICLNFIRTKKIKIHTIHLNNELPDPKIWDLIQIQIFFQKKDLIRSQSDLFQSFIDDLFRSFPIHSDLFRSINPGFLQYSSL